MPARAPLTGDLEGAVGAHDEAGCAGQAIGDERRCPPAARRHDPDRTLSRALNWIALRKQGE